MLSLGIASTKCPQTSSSCFNGGDREQGLTALLSAPCGAMEARHFEEDRLCSDLFLGRSLSFLDLGGLCGDTRDGAGTTGCVDGAAHDLGDSCRKADVTSAHKMSLDERRCLSSKETFLAGGVPDVDSSWLGVATERPGAAAAITRSFAMARRGQKVGDAC